MPTGASIIGGLNAGSRIGQVNAMRKRDEFDMQQQKLANYNSIVGNAAKTLEKFRQEMAVKRATAKSLEDQALIDQKWDEVFKSVTTPLSRAGERSLQAGVPVDTPAQLAQLEPYRKLPDLNAQAMMQAQSAGMKKGAEVGAQESVKREVPEVQNLMAPNGQVIGVDLNAQGSQEYMASLLKQGYSVAPNRQSIKSATTTRDLTPANRTKQENEMYSAEQVALEAREMANRLTKADVGLRGAAGELVFDEVLGQFFESAVNKDRVANRQAIRTMREKALRTMTTDNRLNREDRAGVEKIFPKDSVVESLPAAREKLESLAMLMEQRAARAAGILQGKATHTMSADEIKDAVKNGTMSRDQALRALRTYHGFE